MDVATNRNMVKSPFHPFLVRTASGESYKVVHPECLWIDPEGDVMLVKDKVQGVVLIDIDHASECFREPVKAGRTKRADG